MRYDFRKDAILGPAFEYWQAKCQGKPMPRRADIDPSQLTRLLPHLQITELLDGGARVRYRLVGTAIVTAYGEELTGRYFDDVFEGERLRFVESNYRMMFSEKRPIYVGSRYVSRKEVELFCYRIVMPLSEDGTTINQTLTAMSFKYPNEASQLLGHGVGGDAVLDLNDAFCEVIR
jgi:hypothetical protein